MKSQSRINVKADRINPSELNDKRIDLAEIDNRVHIAKFVEKKKVGQETYEFTFAIINGFSYQPGQYVWLSLPRLKAKDNKGNRRAMSIAKSSADGSSISVVFRNTPSDFKHAALKLKLNDEVEIIGPNGSSFCLPNDKKQQLVLLAGGTGIAPFISLLRSEVLNKTKRRIRLFYTDERGSEAAYHAELHDIKLPGYNFVYSKNPIDATSFADLKNDKGTLFYISGPQGFVDYYYKLLKEVGIKRSSMRFENFYPSSDVVALMRELFKDGEYLPHISGDNELTMQRRDILFSAIQSSSHHIVITDINGVIVLANKAAENITGFAFSEMQGQTPRLWGGLMPTSFYHKLWSSKLHGATINEEIVNRRKDGSLYLVMSHIAPIKDRSGKIIGFIGTEEDITDIRQREIEAKTNASLLESTLLGIAEGLIITDKEGKIKRLNLATCELLGFDKDELIGKKLVDAIELLDKDEKTILKNDRVVERVLTSKKSIISDSIANGFYYRKKDGTTLPVNIAVSPILESRQLVGVIEIFRDISKDKEIDTAKSEFVSLASHQLRTPLSSINWYAEMLLSGDAGKLNKQQQEYMNEVDRANSRMVGLVNSLLNVSRLELGTFVLDSEKLNPKDCAEQILIEIKTKSDEKKQKLDIVFDPKTPEIIFDKKYLEMLYQNLLSNAVKYTPEKGKIELTVRAAKTGEVIDGYKIPKAGIIITVADNGYGIPKNQQDKIMTKLFRADNALDKDADGTGLGLYIIKSVIDHSNGNLWFKSVENKGTTFHAYLPLETAKKEGTKKLS